MHPPPAKFSQLLAKVVDDVPQMYARAAETVDHLGGDRATTVHETGTTVMGETPGQTVASVRASSM